MNMPRIKPRDPRTKAQIVIAAFWSASRQAYLPLTLDDIAARTGLSNDSARDGVRKLIADHLVEIDDAATRKVWKAGHGITGSVAIYRLTTPGERVEASYRVASDTTHDGRPIRRVTVTTAPGYSGGDSRPVAHVSVLAEPWHKEAQA